MNRRLSGSVSRGSRKPLRMAKFVVPLTLFYFFHNRITISDRISVTQKRNEMQHETMPNIVFKSFRKNITNSGDFETNFGQNSAKNLGLKPEQISTRLKRSIKASKKRKRTGKWWVLRRKTRKSAKKQEKSESKQKNQEKQQKRSKRQKLQKHSKHARLERFRPEKSRFRTLKHQPQH